MPLPMTLNIAAHAEGQCLTPLLMPQQCTKPWHQPATMSTMPPVPMPLPLHRLIVVFILFLVVFFIVTVLWLFDSNNSSRCQCTTPACGGVPGPVFFPYIFYTLQRSFWVSCRGKTLFKFKACRTWQGWSLYPQTLLVSLCCLYHLALFWF